MRSSHSLKALLAALVLTPFAGAQTTKPAATLQVGNAAPALTIAKWYKGTPVEQFKPGEMYVVEFWATWCGPCKKSIPHLTELAKKYEGKITFIGVDVYERPDEATQAGVDALVQPFIEKMGDQMGYNVATDGTTGAMVSTWLNAAGKSSIPTAFVVDRNGKIAYIGHPDKLNDVLDPVVAGTWDLAAEAKREGSAVATSAQQAALMDAIAKPLRAHDVKAAAAASDKALAAMPELASNTDFISMRGSALVNTDIAAMVKYTQELTGPDGIITKTPALNWAILRIIPSGVNGVPVSKADYKALAEALAPSMVVAPADFPGYLYKYAELAYHGGDAATATKYQDKALAMLKDDLAKKTGSPTPHDEALLRKYQERADAYRTGESIPAAS